MTHSSLVSRTIPHHNKYSSRNNVKVARTLQHHLAGLGLAADNDLERADVQKSVHYIIYSDGELVGQVPEEYRAWTSGSAAADDPSITIEIENVSTAFNGDDNHPEAWKISQLAYNTLVKLLADIAHRHNFADINDTTYMGHRQVFATACPGGFIWARMGQIREAAKKFRASGEIANLGPLKGIDSGTPIKNNMIELGDFEKLVLEQYINVDNSFGAQCWDLFARFTDWLNLPRVNTFGGQFSGWAGAIWDQYGKNGAEKHWNRIAPDQPSLQGDVPIWGPTPGLYPATHIALTVEDAGDSLWCFSQNSSPSRPNNPYPKDSTGPTILQKLPKTGLLGYLRHKSVISKAPAAIVPPPAVKTISQLADEVLAGKHGDGDTRIAKLGSNYDAVQNEINRRFGVSVVVNISQMADDTLAGKYGNGDERIARLGANYAAVQAEINRRYAAPVPQAKSIAQLADETLAGMHGDGDARIAKLGANYQAVQNEINRRYAVPQAKSISQLADEVLAGMHGDGDVRIAKLGANYQAVQNEINRRYGG